MQKAEPRYGKVWSLSHLFVLQGQTGSSCVLHTGGSLELAEEQEEGAGSKLGLPSLRLPVRILL